MKTVWILIVVALVVGSVYADHRWKCWLARQRAERERHPESWR